MYRTLRTRSWTGLAWFAGTGLLAGCAVDLADQTLLASEQRDEIAHGTSGALLARMACTATDATFNSLPANFADLPQGALLHCQERAALSDLPGYMRYRVLYKSSTRVGSDDVSLAASGEVYVPRADRAQAEDRLVIANTSGAVGLLAACGPSVRAPFPDRGSIANVVSALGSVRPELQRGLPAIVVPDYLGLGFSPGLRSAEQELTVADPFNYDWSRLRPRQRPVFSRLTHSYVSIAAEGRSTVDLVRAARQIIGAGIAERPRWFVVGHSQGGHAALAAGEVVASGYEHDTHLLGVVAGAPGSELSNSQDGFPLVTSFLEMMTLGAFSLEQPNLRPSTYLTTQALQAFSYTVNTGCLSSDGLAGWLGTYYGFVGNGSPIRGGGSLTQKPEFQALLVANSPGHEPTLAPIFVGQVDGDPFIWRARTDKLVGRLRQTHGATTDLTTYCVYRPLTDPRAPPADFGAFASYFSRVSENHQALRPMLQHRLPNGYDATPLRCLGPGDVALDPQETSALSWLSALYRRALENDAR